MSLLVKTLRSNKFNPRIGGATVGQTTRNFFSKKCPKPAAENKCGGAGLSSGASGAGEVPAGYKLLKETQAKFQVKDGLPVWLKGGPTDRILYMTTVGLAVAGLGCSLTLIMGLILK